MAEFLPQTGICDYCGGEADERHELNYLSCTFQQCEGGLYHQECLYQFLRSNRLEKVRAQGKPTCLKMRSESSKKDENIILLRRTAKRASSAHEDVGRAPNGHNLALAG